MNRPDIHLRALCHAAIQEAKDTGTTRAELADLAHRAMEGDGEGLGHGAEGAATEIHVPACHYHPVTP